MIKGIKEPKKHHNSPILYEKYMILKYKKKYVTKNRINEYVKLDK
jgi:late competence protein required for DNA uptake (superfamily II DNA/RNA helicase)